MPPKLKLLPIGTVVKRLKDDWAITVKARDGFKCVLCGGVDLLTAHHWYFTKQEGRAARFCYDNGATMCYTCHIRKLHQNPGYHTVNAVYMAVIANSPGFAATEIERLAGIDLTTADLRALYAERFTDTKPIGLVFTIIPQFHIIQGRISLRVDPANRRQLCILPGKRVRILGCAYPGTPPTSITATVQNVTDAKPDERLTLEPTAELKQWILDNVE